MPVAVLRAIRSGRPSPLMSPGEVRTSYWFQPLVPSEVYAVDGFSVP
ncbi:hypothetical protein ACFXKI_50300 [Streptomyces mirabilis]